MMWCSLVIIFRSLADVKCEEIARHIFSYKRFSAVISCGTKFAFILQVPDVINHGLTEKEVSSLDRKT